MDADLFNKHIAVMAGWPREDIDNVRHYANHGRPEGQGYAVAALLADRGADVTVIAPAKNHLVPPPRCRLIQEIEGKPIMSGVELVRATQAFVAVNACDAVLPLACISSVRAAQKSEQKLKVKHEAGESIEMAVVGNVDMEEAVHSWGTTYLGFNSRHEKIFSGYVSAIAGQEKPYYSDLPDWLLPLVPRLKAETGAGYPSTVQVSPLPPDIASVDPETFAGKTALMTAGPTEEAITPWMDVITNFSSGRQAYELARVLAALGARVVYVTGPTDFPDPADKNISVVHAASARHMLDECLRHLPADMFIGVAAVADFGCLNPPAIRLAEGHPFTLTLNQNPDILQTIGHHETLRPAFVAGFAAETDPQNIIAYAKGKLAKKKADLICANPVGRSSGHNSRENQITLVTNDSEPRVLKKMSKGEAALAIVQEIADRFPAVERSLKKNVFELRMDLINH